MPSAPLLTLYGWLAWAGWAPIRLMLEWRRGMGKEDPVRFPERLGRAGRPRPPGPLVWLHGASVGEALSALPLIAALKARRPDLVFLFTTGTVTSAQLLAERLPEDVIHQFVPVDRPAWVRRFLGHWRPDLVLWLESELWPNHLAEIGRRGTPLVLLNGRVSERSYRFWKKHPHTARALLAPFALCLAQSRRDGERLAAMGAAAVAVPGNLKSASPALPVDAAELTRLQGELGERPRWLALSTHAGEEEMAGRLHARLAPRHPGLLTIVVPRHPQRGDAVEAALTAMGLRVARRSAGTRPDPRDDIYLMDTMGEVGLACRLSPVAFIGKTLAGGGGQNPLEAARLGCAVLWGPDMGNFAEMAGDMLAAAAAQGVADEAGLEAALDGLLGRPAAAAAQGEAARRFAETETAVIDRIVERLAPHLPPAGTA